LIGESASLLIFQTGHQQSLVAVRQAKHPAAQIGPSGNPNRPDSTRAERQPENRRFVYGQMRSNDITPPRLQLGIGMKNQQPVRCSQITATAQLPAARWWPGNDPCSGFICQSQGGVF
jgi:hypothetical protein